MGFLWGGYRGHVEPDAPPKPPSVNQGKHRGITKSNKPKRKR